MHVRHGLAVLGLGLLLPIPAAAYGFDVTKCDDDGVTVVPSYALSRDADQCLLVDPGNGDPPVKFQWDIRNYTMFDYNAVKDDPNWPTTAAAHGWKVLDMADAGGNSALIPASTGCKGEPFTNVCTFIVENVTIDNFAYDWTYREDGLHLGYGPQNLWVWFKDVNVLNGWVCNAAWAGPGGADAASCPGDTCPSGGCAHSDGVQMEGQPHYGGISGPAGGGGGFQVWTGGKIVNGYNANTRFQGKASTTERSGVIYDRGPTGILALHGARIGREHPSGLSVNYFDECMQFSGGNTEICDGTFTNMNVFSSDFSELWFVNVVGSAPASAGGYATVDIPGGEQGKVIIVNTGCRETGCISDPGNIRYVSGWPHPVTGINSAIGPGTCPGNSETADGLIKASSPPTYCYTAMEYAITDGDGAGPDIAHKPFPFADKADYGWITPPSGGALSMTLVSDKSTLAVDEDFTLTATPSLGATPYNRVDFDCDDDDLFGADDEPDDAIDTAAPYTALCPGFTPSGAYTPSARVTDDVGSQFTKSVSVTVLATCGDNIVQPPEECDGTSIPQDCADIGFSEPGTPGCIACALTQGTCVANACGDGSCTAGETEVTCPADCADFTVAVMAKGINGWDYYDPTFLDGDVIDYGQIPSGLINILVETATADGNPWDSFRFCLDDDADCGTGPTTLWSTAQSSKPYSMCGDFGPNIQTDLCGCGENTGNSACIAVLEPVIPSGLHSLQITPCTTNWVGGTESPFPDSECTGTLGPTRAINFTVLPSAGSQCPVQPSTP